MRKKTEKIHQVVVREEHGTETEDGLQHTRYRTLMGVQLKPTQQESPQGQNTGCPRIQQVSLLRLA